MASSYQHTGISSLLIVQSNLVIYALTSMEPSRLANRTTVKSYTLPLFSTWMRVCLVQSVRPFFSHQINDDIIYLVIESHSQFCGPCWAYFGGQLAPTPKGTCGLINAGFSIQKFRPVIRWRVFFNRHHPFFVAYNCHVGILKMRVSKIITCPTGWKHTHYLFKNLSRYC